MAFGSALHPSYRGHDSARSTSMVTAEDGIRPRLSSPCPLFCPRLTGAGATSGSGPGQTIPWWKSWTKKYVILCCICGGTAVLLGVVFIAIYFTLHTYTSSLQYFETIPTYVPAIVLIITGLLVICFARRKNRYAYLIKLAGGCCLMCALLCVVITVTTTVIHMNRLQTLRECVYAQKAKTCTCFAGIGDDEGSSRYVFSNTPDCEVVHGSLYACLRAMFGLSVVGILVCIFSSMLVYQLLSHEKKKMYWEQLEMRRRFFYRQPSHYPYCSCYDDYGFASPHDCYSNWHSWEINNDQVWAGRSMASSSLRCTPSPDNTSQRSVLVGSSGHRASGWNWLPWNWGAGGGNNSTADRQTATLSSSAAGTAPNDGSTVFQVSAQSDLIENNRNPIPGGIVYNGTPPSASAAAAAGGTASSLSLLGRVRGPSASASTTSRRHGCRNESRFRLRRHHPQTGSRRRRSNDAVFHHLHMSPSRYQPLFVADGGYLPPLLYPTYSTMRYAWGPPPPYSQPSSVENVSSADGAANLNISLQDENLTSCPTRRQGPQQQQQQHRHHILCRPELERSNQLENAEVGVGIKFDGNDGVMGGGSIDDGTGGVGGGMRHHHHAKLSSHPTANREFVSEVILLGNEDPRSFSSEIVQEERGGKNPNDPCLVEVHVPYEVNIHKIDCYNRASTLPSRHMHNNKLNDDTTKSALHIPNSNNSACWTANGRCPHHHQQIPPPPHHPALPPLQLPLDYRHQPSVDSKEEASERSVFLTDADRFVAGSNLLSSSNSSSSGSFDVDEDDVDDVDADSNFHHSMVVSTTPSTPVADNVLLFPADLLCAKSLPNLNLTLGFNPNSNPSSNGNDPNAGELIADNTSSCNLVTITNNNNNNHNTSGVVEDNNSSTSTTNEDRSRDPFFSAPLLCQQLRNSTVGSGLSESSPTLPFNGFVANANTNHSSSKGSNQRNQLSPINLLVHSVVDHNNHDNNSSTAAATKSRSLINLSPQDNIIVSFKSIHV